MEGTRLTCLALYLEDYLSVLRSGPIDISVNPMDIIEGVVNIYHCLYEPIVQNGCNIKFWRFENLQQVRNDSC